MIYLEYVEYKRRYQETQETLAAILTEKEYLFNRTQPKALTYDSDRVQGGKNANVFESYMIAKEKAQIDSRLAEAKGLLDDRGKLLKLKEQELRDSKLLADIIYRMRFLERKRVYIIARNLHYSKKQIYNYLNQIQNNIAQNFTKTGI